MTFVSGCINTPHKVRTSAPNTSADIYDPFEGFNRHVTTFNNGADKYVIHPLATVYKTVLPKPIRKGVNNASKNIGEPVVFVNEVLQLDFDDAMDSLGRFLLNSSFGLGGFIDVASKQGLEQPNEDFGQTLATYKVPPGPYLVLPLLGPSTARDAVGRIGDGLTTPLKWVDFSGDSAIQIGRRVSTGLDSRVRAEPFLENIRGSADPYINLRGVYTQNRLNNIHEDADDFETSSGFDEFDDIDDGFADIDDSNDGFADFDDVEPSSDIIDDGFADIE